MMSRWVLLAGCAAIAGANVAQAQARAGTASRAPAPPAAALAAITEADLKRDLFAVAGDNFPGREAETLDEMRASEGWCFRTGNAARRRDLVPGFRLER